MPEHRIRLRGGWECLSREGDGAGLEVARRLDLPVNSPDELPRQFRLTRLFGRPPVDDRSERVTLEMRNVAGLRSARLNGSPIGPIDGDVVDCSVPLDGPLLPRNGLILEVDRGEPAPASVSTWGEIALVIRPR